MLKFLRQEIQKIADLITEYMNIYPKYVEKIICGLTKLVMKIFFLIKVFHISLSSNEVLL